MVNAGKKKVIGRKDTVVISKQAWSSEFNFQKVMRISVAAILIARIPLIYQPWSFPVAIVLGALGFGYLLNMEKQIKRIVLVEVFVAAFIGFILYLSIFLTSREAWTTLIGTSYPGGRRSTSGFISVPNFSGPFDFILRDSQYSSILQRTNQSEAALSPLILGFFVIVLLTLAHTKIRELSHLKSYLFLLLSIVYLGSWIVFPGLENNFLFKPMTIFPSERIAQIGGVVMTILFLVIINISKDFLSKYRKYVLSVVAVSAFVSSYLGGRNLRANGITLKQLDTLLVSLIFTFC
jgi:hypothetical protein